jgi:hypothetical protein
MPYTEVMMNDAVAKAVKASNAACEAQQTLGVLSPEAMRLTGLIAPLVRVLDDDGHKAYNRAIRAYARNRAVAGTIEAVGGQPAQFGYESALAMAADMRKRFPAVGKAARVATGTTTNYRTPALDDAVLEALAAF